MTYKDRMQALADAFEVVPRDDDGGRFQRLRDGSPEWMTDAVREAHDDEFPDDWRYDMCARLASDLAEREHESADDARDDVHEIADGLADVYTASVFRWYADYPSRQSYADEALSEWGQPKDAVTLLQAGQYLAIRQMADALIQAVEDADDDSDGEG